MRGHSKPKDTLSKVLPIRWSLGSKDRHKPEPVPQPVKEPGPVELVQYLESGRRPRCTKDPIVKLMSKPRSTKDVAEGQAAADVQPSSLSRDVKTGDDSPRVPEGQRRPSEKTASLRQGQTRDVTTVNISSSSSTNTLTRRKDAKKQSLFNVSQDTKTKRSSSAGVQSSNSSPSLHDETMRRQKGDQTDHSTYEEKAKTKKGEAPKSHEGLISFFKGNFLKKNKDSNRTMEAESSKGFGEQGGSRRSHSKLSLSNGGATGGTRAEEGKSTGSDHLGNKMANGKVGQTTSGIKRSQSSSNIPAKAEQSVRRTASLHRNGMSTGPTPSRSLTADKPSYGTLQRTRYSTTSLGRKRPVPESSF